MARRVTLRRTEAPKTRVFVSFDFDRDRLLKELLVGQSRLPGSPFTVADWSMKEAAPEKDWISKAEFRIANADIVVVVVGSETYRARGVLKEIRIARALGKRVVQVIGQSDREYRRVPNAGVLYRWNWDNLRKLLAKR